MATLINKDKQISKQRQEFVEHNFEAMVGARKRRYNDTPQQKQRTEFFEDYYLLYTRTKNKWQKLKEWLEQAIQEQSDCSHELVQHSINVEQWVLDKMQELEKENAES